MTLIICKMQSVQGYRGIQRGARRVQSEVIREDNVI